MSLFLVVLLLVVVQALCAFFFHLGRKTPFPSSFIEVGRMFCLPYVVKHYINGDE